MTPPPSRDAADVNLRAYVDRKFAELFARMDHSDEIAKSNGMALDIILKHLGLLEQEDEREP